jgi:hypothetical protein
MAMMHRSIINSLASQTNSTTTISNNNNPMQAFHLVARLAITTA